MPTTTDPTTPPAKAPTRRTRATSTTSEGGRGEPPPPRGAPSPVGSAKPDACSAPSREFRHAKAAPEVPPGPAYGPAGRELVSRIVAQLDEQGCEPDARDEVLLDQAARLADRMVALRGLVERDGERSVSDSGIVRLHPAIPEHRQHAVALAKVLAAVRIPDDTGEVKDPAKVRAADTRWRQHNAGKVAAQVEREGLTRGGR